MDGHAMTATTAPTPADEPEPSEAGDQPAAIVNQTLEDLAREGARRMLERALAAEVDEFLGRARYQRRLLAEHGYRNGYGRPRAVAIGTWPVEVRAPRIRDLPEDVESFHSSILPRRRMLSAETQRLFARLYLEGLSSGDFEPAFRELLGETAPLSASTILRLKDEWATEYAAWRVRPLTSRFAYIWADGIYLGAGIELENSCLLVVVGAREDGRKELLAMELGYRESAASWAGVLRDLRDRGMAAPLLACGDGALGLWAALDEVLPTTRHQRCWNHRVLNVLDKVPKRLWPETRRRLREAWSSDSRAECELRRDALVRWLEAHGQMSAAETVLRDWDDFVTFYDFPAEHWIHLRTSNPIESLFAGVRLRTDVAKRMRRRENALYLVFKIAQRLEHSWRPLNGGLTVMTLLLGGARFVDGVYTPRSAAVSAA
ncbi:MAG TPA: IS256 family transposase [Candidatus Limnocylindria bacterium]|nr:IS256 family transposase [Candidatus Limnocylindria bacterium]